MKAILLILSMAVYTCSITARNGDGKQRIGGGIRAWVDDSTDFNRRFNDEIMLANFKPYPLNDPTAVLEVKVLHKLDERTSSNLDSVKVLSKRLATYLVRQDNFRLGKEIDIDISRYGYTGAAAPDALPLQRKIVFKYPRKAK